MVNISVKKRKGHRESLDIEKIHKVLEWATQDLPNTSVSDIEMKSHIQIYDDISTEQIHDILTKAAEDLIKQEYNYQYVAARLALFHLRKKVLGQYDPIHIRDLVQQNINRGAYDPQLLSYYTNDEWDRINSFMDHQRDYRLTIAAVKQAVDKYLVKDRTTGEIYETPQYAFMLIPCVMFRNYPRETRLNYVRDFYDAITRFQISLPTPILAGVRTSTKQFSSCVLIDVDDNLDSIGDAATAIMKYGAKRAGIGVNGGRIRAVKSRIRGGEVSHTGVTHYYRKFESSLKCCSQGGIRDAAMSLYVPVWHLEIEDIMVLKNNKGTDDNRVRHMDAVAGVLSRQALCQTAQCKFGAAESREQRPCAHAARGATEDQDGQGRTIGLPLQQQVGEYRQQHQSDHAEDIGNRQHPAVHDDELSRTNA
jgi:ribonucleoside-diphosphate reductase alpha chain